MNFDIPLKDGGGGGPACPERSDVTGNKSGIWCGKEYCEGDGGNGIRMTKRSIFFFFLGYHYLLDRVQKRVHIPLETWKSINVHFSIFMSPLTCVKKHNI